MNWKLSQTERVLLLKRHKKERNGKVRDRIKAVLAYDEGYSYAEISKILLLDDETVRRHIQDYFSKHKLSPESGGSKSSLTDEQSLELVRHLKNTLYLYVKDICRYVKQTYQVYYSISGMTQWLHRRGFRYKKPQGVPGKCNKSHQAEFITYYEKLKKKAGKKEPIYFVDSVHPEHQTHLTYGWILKGQRKNMAMTGRQYRLNLMGGICLNGHRVVYEQSDKVNEVSIQSFLYKLRKQHVGHYNVHVIWDNAGYHHSKKVQEFAKELGIEIHYLPPYSPNLNPVERLWKIMHEHVTYNKYYEKFSDFTEAILHFFRHIGKKKRLLGSRITDNFQLIEVT